MSESENRPMSFIKLSGSITERRSGICLEPSHAKMIWQGNKDIIILSKSYRFATNKPFYLIGGNDCYGVILLTKSTRISLSDFDSLRNRHRITDDERKNWWPNKQILFSYDLKVIDKFKAPKTVRMPEEGKRFIREVSFIIEDEATEKIENVNKYDVGKLRLDQLKNNLRIALAWHISKTSGTEIPYTFQLIEYVLKNTIIELVRRGVSFYPAKMDENTRKIFIKIIGKDFEKSCLGSKKISVGDKVKVNGKLGTVKKIGV